MFNNKQLLKGLRAIVLKRCSSVEQIDKSMSNQTRTTDQAIDELGLICVETFDLPGVSGSVPGNRTDIDAIIARKKKDNDFEVLLIQDASRFTRAGGGHGQKLIYDLRAAGIKVYFVAEDVLIDCDMAEMYVSFLFCAARHTVKMLAYNAANGSMASYLANNSPHAKRPPFGLDRMYANNGTDMHVIRNLPDGTQEQIDPVTLSIVRRFSRNTSTGIPNHYIKQKAETIRLVPGDPKHVAVVHLMFRLHLVDGWSFRQIAKYLNDNRVPSARDEEWHVSSVRNVILNPIYIGEGIRCRTKKGVYYNMGEGSPQPSTLTVEDLANNKRIKPVMRPRDEWLLRPQPHLVEFLPEEFRELAIPRIHMHLASIAEAKPKKAKRDSHPNSSFWLKDKLRSVQGNYRMTGRVGGKAGSVRTYGVGRGISVPKTNNVLARRIPAEPLEAAVMEMLRVVLLNRPGIEDGLKRIIAEERSNHRNDQINPEQIRKEYQRKRKQLGALSDQISLEDDDALNRKIDGLKAEIQSLGQRLDEVQRQQPKALMDVGSVAMELAREFESFGRTIHEQDIAHVKRIVDILVSKMEADLETKQVEVEFAIPSWLVDVISQQDGVGLENCSVYRPVKEAHPENRVILGTFVCDKDGRPTCYTCRRSRLVA